MCTSLLNSCLLTYGQTVGKPISFGLVSCPTCGAIVYFSTESVIKVEHNKYHPLNRLILCDTLRRIKPDKYHHGLLFASNPSTYYTPFPPISHFLYDMQLSVLYRTSGGGASLSHLSASFKDSNSKSSSETFPALTAIVK